MKEAIVASAATLPQAFADIALAMLRLGVSIDQSAMKDCEVREVRAHGASLEALLVRWIEECQYVQEIEGFACRAIEFAVFDIEPKAGAEPLRLHALLRGETGASGDRDSGTRSVSARDVAIRRVDDGFEIRLVIEG